jgi:hypothetical protein
MPSIMRSSAAFSWLTGSFGFMRFSLRALGQHAAGGAPPVPPEAFVGPSSSTELRLDFAGQQAAQSPPNRRQEPATLSSLSTFSYWVSGLGPPFRTHSEGGSSIAKLRQASHFVQMPNARGARGCFSAPLWRIWPCGLYERNCLPLTLIRLDVTTGAASQRIRTISGRWNHLLQQLSHLPCIVTPSPSRLESRCDQLTGLPLDFKLGTPPVDDNANSTQPVDIADN